MKKRNLISLITLIVTTFIFTGYTNAQQGTPYRVTDRQVENLLTQIETRSNAFRDVIDRTLDNSNIDDTNREDSINQMVANFENATDSLKRNFQDRRSTSSDVREVLNRAALINSFMRNNRVTPNAQRQWTMLRTDLDTLAGYYRVNTNWNVVTPVNNGNQYNYTVTDYQMRTLLNRIKQRSTAFRQSFDRANNWGRGNQSNQVSDVYRNITDFDNAVIALRNGFTNRNASRSQLDAVMQSSSLINTFIITNRTNNDVTNKWTLVRNDLNTLASYYRMPWDWNNPTMPGQQYGGFDQRLTGSYRLNTGLSDNVTTVVDRAIENANYDQAQTDRVRRNTERRLASPATLSLEKNGQQITMSSANAAAVSLNADGVVRTETSPNGRTVSVSVTATNRDLTINYEGDRMNDYNVVFMPTNNGQLRVTRRLYLENQNQTVTATSVYDKISQTPQWDTPNYPTGTGTANDNFYIPNNTAIIATLDTPLSTRTARDGDRFSMTVNSPSQYDGAVIEGRVNGERSGVVSGRANMALSFETIRLRDGRTFRFAGIVDGVRERNGNTVNVNNEGSIRDDSQTTKTVTRAGVGAILGAIIGAIAGGGQGAAIGAGVGAGAGAGTVVLQGRDNLELDRGTQFSITATAPANIR
ncbi:MAG: hypothetical protein KA746_14190 [Pyrinomonadaceae bacterium]|nr:hypothetical protein [Pyrinomonadaceae bacterium]MBP6211844.1 hypothetical protein [Pyrinomonadaceae bacterium]